LARGAEGDGRRWSLKSNLGLIKVTIYKPRGDKPIQSIGCGFVFALARCNCYIRHRRILGGPGEQRDHAPQDAKNRPFCLAYAVHYSVQ